MNSSDKDFKLLVIGGSAGSLTVVMKILPLLDKQMNMAVIIVFHRKSADDSTLTDVLSGKTVFEVKEVDDKDEIRQGVVYLAPPDYHVLIEKDTVLTLDVSERVHYSRPSIDVTFESAAEVYGSSLVCMLLSGANADGVDGLIAAQKKGAFIIVQDPESAEVPYMPDQALQKVKIDWLMTALNLNSLPAVLFP